MEEAVSRYKVALALDLGGLGPRPLLFDRDGLPRIRMVRPINSLNDQQVGDMVDEDAMMEFLFASCIVSKLQQSSDTHV